MLANDQGNDRKTTGPVVITVHGTFAGNLRKEPPHWWQSEATLAIELTKKLGGDAVVEPFTWRDQERTGPNRESERKIAGRRLFEKLSELEGKNGEPGTPYHLVGHSHGGSVIWHALKESTRARKQLSCLKSWTTVATPFIEFGPDGSWLRHLLGAIAAIVVLYFFGFWQLAFELAVLAQQRNPQLLMDRLPLSHELSDLHAAVGDWLYYALLTGTAATALFFLVVLALPLKDLFRVLITYPRERRALQTATTWYEPLWLGLLHPNDEAMAGLKATLIRAPDLVLRQRRGLAGLLFSPLKPLARPVDEFAWSTLMKNAQGDDIVDEIVRRIATAPEPFSRGPAPLPAEVIASITARADAASATVLTRLRDRIGALSDQADVAALIAIMSGTYDEDSLIHTSMFEEPAVCDAIVAHIEAAKTAESATAPAIRTASPPRALIWAKAMVAVAVVALVAVLASAGYRILVYPETNLAAAESILARFDDPAFQALANDQGPGNAIVRAHRLGIAFDRALGVAGKLDDKQTRSQAYQLLMRELVLTNRVGYLGELLTAPMPAPVPPYRTVDYLTVGTASALEVFVQTSPVSSGLGAPQLLQAIADMVSRSFSGESQRYLLGRLIPMAVALENTNGLTWMKQVGETDPDCKNWDSIIPEAAALISKSTQAVFLNTLITACNPKTGAEDKQRMLRRIAVGALRACEFAGPLLKEVSTHRAGKDAPVPPHFIECLARERKDDANALAIEARRLLARTSKTAEIRQIWQMSQVLKAAGLTAEATQWAETAIRFATEPDKQEEKERDTLQQFNNDVLKLEILAAIDVARHDAFMAQLAKSADEFDRSRKFSESWAALRHVYAVHADRKPGTSCTLSSAEFGTVRAVILIASYYPEKNPSAIATVLLPLVDRCKIEMNDGLLSDIVKIVSGNSVSADRARYIAMTAPFQNNLRRAMATAETAALPSDILSGYVAAIDRHRPSTRRQTEYGYNPIKYNPVAASTW
jgi:hypothetical protein